MEKPYILGTKYNGKELSGYGGTANNDLKAIHTRSGHIIKLDDTDGGESITITDKNGNIIHLDTAKSTITITAPENMTLNAKNMQINVTEDMEVNVGKNKTEQTGEILQVRSGTKIEEVERELSLYVQESLTQLSGEATVETNQRDMVLRGAGIAVFQGGMDVKISKG